MLQENCLYQDIGGETLHIVGRVRDYSAKSPYFWSLHGDWYHEIAGQFVSASRVSCEPLVLKRVLLPLGCRQNIDLEAAVPICKGLDFTPIPATRKKR